jgi:sRNA-binding regulator protein Hfq
MKKKLNPNFVTGFSDAEACFHVSILRNTKFNVGMSVGVFFQISLNKRDKSLLMELKDYFGVGNIRYRKDGVLFYQVFTVKDLKRVVEHFDKYPLMTKKQADYLLFKMAIDLIDNKEHLTMEGLRKLVSIRASMNFGIPESLKEVFPNIIPITTPELNNALNLNPH